MPVDLEKYVDQRFRDLEAKMSLIEGGIYRAAQSTNASLERLVGLVEEMRNQRYITQEMLQAELNAHIDVDQSFHDDVQGRLREIERILANYAGRLWGLGIIVTVVSVAATFIARWLGR